jgi:hypothetical protein
MVYVCALIEVCVSSILMVGLQFVMCTVCGVCLEQNEFAHSALVSLCVSVCEVCSTEHDQNTFYILEHLLLHKEIHVFSSKPDNLCLNIALLLALTLCIKLVSCLPPGP